jgi:hypothetical protein
VVEFEPKQSWVQSLKQLKKEEQKIKVLPGDQKPDRIKIFTDSIGVKTDIS